MSEAKIPSGGAGRTKPARALTARALDALKPESAPYRVPDSKCQGLAVRVSASGARTFDLAYRIKGGSGRRISLGAYPDRTLDEARDRANELTKAARSGRDLVAEERFAAEEAGRRLSVWALIDRYMQRPAATKLKTAKEIESRLRRALQPIKDRAADDIRRRDLRELFNKTFEEGLPREAEQRRISVGAMFRWGIEEDIVETDPTAGLRSFGAGEPRDRVLTRDEIALVWAHLEDRKRLPEPHATCLMVELLVGARCGEIGAMHTREFDLDNWIWVLPASRSKNGKPRATPIVGRARAIIEARWPVASGYLFVSEAGGPLPSSLIGQALSKHRHKISIPHFASHDLRRTVASGMDELGIVEETIAAVLGHEAVATRTTKTLRRHYLHGDKMERKRAALIAWDAEVTRILEGRTESNVLTLRRSG